MKYLTLLILLLSLSVKSQTRVIPVVFHVLHEYGPENISKWQIQDAIRILNEDFQKRNADTSEIIPVFKPIAADCEIEFRLATIDPLGNCTDGIDRIVSIKTFQADNASKINPWPNNKYLNIWVANTLENSGAAAFATLPGGPDSTDGIIIWYQFVGSFGTSDYQNARELTHAVGTYFNLHYTFQSAITGCGDDGISDTPETAGSLTCNLALSDCNPPIIENVQNFMDISPCKRMFTNGQKARMDSTLNSSLSGRNNLWTLSNLMATGTDAPPINPCSPVADFKSSGSACVNDTIIFTDQSWNTGITSWSWSLPGATPSTSTDSMPIVTYLNAGLYDATLIVSNAVGSDTITKTGIVHVTDTAQYSMPFGEDFENPASFPGTDGWLESFIDDSLTQRINTANTTPGGSWSVLFNNYDNDVNEIESWITPSIDFTNITFPIHLTFKVAHAQRNVNSDDELRIFYSIDCGETWVSTTYFKFGSTLATAPLSSSFFIPADTTQWRSETLTCNAVQQQSNVRFKFTCNSDAGNNVYIDDIMISGSFVGIEELPDLFNINLYPNPSHGTATLSFDLLKKGHVISTVNNLPGQIITTILDKNLQSGRHEIKIPELAPGLYFIETSIGDAHYVRRLVIN